MRTKIANRVLVLLPLYLALFSPAAGAQLGNFNFDPEPVGPRNIADPEAWKEANIRLPPWPKDSDLVEFSPDGVDEPFRFFVDGSTLSPGSDGVVRYTMVVQSNKGLRNVSFEGIRCTIRGHFKTYAYGSDGSFTRIPGAEWQDLPRRGVQAYVEDLFRNRFCVPREGRPRVKKDILRALNDRGRPEHSTGFQAD